MGMKDKDEKDERLSEQSKERKTPYIDILIRHE